MGVYPTIREKKIRQRAENNRSDGRGHYRSIESPYQTVHEDRISTERDEAIRRVKPPQPYSYLPEAFRAALAPGEALVPDEVVEDGDFDRDRRCRDAPKGEVLGEQRNEQ